MFSLSLYCLPLATKYRAICAQVVKVEEEEVEEASINDALQSQTVRHSDSVRCPTLHFPHQAERRVAAIAAFGGAGAWSRHDHSAVVETDARQSVRGPQSGPKEEWARRRAPTIPPRAQGPNPELRRCSPTGCERRDHWTANPPPLEGCVFRPMSEAKACLRAVAAGSLPLRRSHR